MGRFARNTGQIFTGLRVRLLLLVVLVCAPFIGLVLHTSWDDRRKARTGWSQHSQTLAQAAAQQEDKLVSATRQILHAIAESSPVCTGSQRASQKLVDHLIGAYPRYSNLALIRTNGQVFASAAAMPHGPNAAERRLIARIASSRAFNTGRLSTARSLTNGAVSFGYPVFDENGCVQLVAMAWVRPEQISRFGSELAALVPKGATWTQVSRNGSILVRSPARDVWRERTMGEKWVLQEAGMREDGLIEAPSTQGALSLFGFSVIESKMISGRVVGFLSIPTDTLFADANRALWRNLLWLAIAAGLASALGYAGSNILVLHPVKGLANLSTRLASGDLRARTGLPYGRDELGRLSESFDQMAQALEKRELEHQRASRKLRVLSRRLVEVQEAERRHIARELHDEIGQSLTAAGINLQAALGCKGLGKAAPRLKICAETIERVLEQVHDLSLNLRPSMLDDLGLESAIRWYTDRQAGVCGLDSRFEADPMENRLDPVIETECFRVAQEALTNVVKHAQANSVRVTLSQENGCLHLRISDDGRGFDVAPARDTAVRGASLGLLSMEERAVLAGGGFEVRSRPGHGTEVRAWFPLKWRR